LKIALPAVHAVKVVLRELSASGSQYISLTRQSALIAAPVQRFALWMHAKLQAPEDGGYY